MNRLSDRRDLTDKQPKGGEGMSLARSWHCGHRHTSGKVRSLGRGLPPLLWKCANCAKESK